MNHNELLQKFYSSFSNGNAKGMIDCYHENIVFQDPAFGILKGNRAKYMWDMLLSKKDNDLRIDYKILKTDDKNGKVNWTARYNYGPKKRKVINKVTANFEFKDGKILKHTDDFNLWIWSKQALGTSGYLLGWSSYMRDQIQKKINKLLSSFIEKKTIPKSGPRE